MRSFKQAMMISNYRSRLLKATSRHCAFWALRAFFAAVLLIALFSSAQGQQQPPAPGQEAPVEGEAPAGTPIKNPFGDMNLRMHWVLLEQYSFVLHPFYQMTGDPGFSNGKAASAFIFNIGTKDTDQNTNFILKALHALPPFGLEGVSKLDLKFLGGIGVGYDHFVYTMVDTEVAYGVPSVIPIQADFYIENAVLRFYLFNPDEPGANFFFGTGVGMLNGVFKASPYAGQEPQYIDFSQNIMGTWRWGLESKGDNWGFRYELIIVGANEVVIGAENPYPGSSASVLNFSGTIVRMNLFTQF